jgi:hypothetical protein
MPGYLFRVASAGIKIVPSRRTSSSVRMNSRSVRESSVNNTVESLSPIPFVRESSFQTVQNSDIVPERETNQGSDPLAPIAPVDSREITALASAHSAEMKADEDWTPPIIGNPGASSASVVVSPQLRSSGAPVVSENQSDESGVLEPVVEMHVGSDLPYDQTAESSRVPRWSALPPSSELLLPTRRSEGPASPNHWPRLPKVQPADTTVAPVHAEPDLSKASQSVQPLEDHFDPPVSFEAIPIDIPTPPIVHPTAPGQAKPSRPPFPAPPGGLTIQRLEVKIVESPQGASNAPSPPIAVPPGVNTWDGPDRRHQLRIG